MAVGKRVCSICDEKLSTGSYDKHMKTHDMKSIKISNDMRDACRTMCMICDKPFILTRMRSHTKEKHSITVSEYRKQFNLPGRFEIIEKVFHKCGICDDIVLLDSDLIGSHLHKHSGVTHGQYNEKYMKTARRSKDEPDTESEPDKAKESDSKVAGEEKSICFCQTKGGVILRCSRESCLVGSFHLACVGLDSLPEGTWFCNECVIDVGDIGKVTTDETDDMDSTNKTTGEKNVEPDYEKAQSDVIDHKCDECEKVFPKKLLLLNHYSQLHYRLYLTEIAKVFFDNSEECGQCEEETGGCSSTALKLIHIGEYHANFSMMVKNARDLGC